MGSTPGVQLRLRSTTRVRVTVSVSVAFAVAVVTAASGPAWAKSPTYRLRIESTPSGAIVQVGDHILEQPTPVTVRVSPGEHTIRVEKNGFKLVTKKVRVASKKSIQLLRVSLASVAYVHVLPPRGRLETKGSEILVDGELAGTVPTTLELAPGPHQVVIRKPGFSNYETWIELGEGDTLTISAKLGTVSARRVNSRGAQKNASRPSLQDRFVVGLAVVGGWRRFSYRDPGSSHLLEFSADHNLIVRIDARFRPSVRDPRWSRLSLFGSAALAKPLDTTADVSDDRARSAWDTVTFALAYDLATAGLTWTPHLGYRKESFSFSETGALVGRLPSVDYQSIAAGISITTRYRDLAITGDLAWLHSLDTGEIAERFGGASVLSGRVAIDASYPFSRRGDATAQLEYSRYLHSFDTVSGDLYDAAGADDHLIMLGVGARVRM